MVTQKTLNSQSNLEEKKNKQKKTKTELEDSGSVTSDYITNLQ